MLLIKGVAINLTKSSLRSSGTRPDDTTEDTTDYTPTGAATTPPDSPPSLQSGVVLRTRGTLRGHRGLG